jgi:hypothetical protein
MRRHLPAAVRVPLNGLPSKFAVWRWFRRQAGRRRRAAAATGSPAIVQAELCAVLHGLRNLHSSTSANQKYF